MESVKKSIEMVGISEKSWEDAANSILVKTSETLEDARIYEVEEMDRLDRGCRSLLGRRWVAEVKEMDIKLDGAKPVYRVKMCFSLRA